MTDNDDLRERVARAICEANCKEWRTGTYRAGGFHDADPLNNHWRHMADAALSATPTEALQQALTEIARVEQLGSGMARIVHGRSAKAIADAALAHIAARAALGDDVG